MSLKNMVKGPARNLKASGRQAARSLALSLLSVVSKKKTAEALATNRIQNLYFHFLPEEDEKNFMSIISRLEEDHFFISYSEAIARIESGEIDRPYLTISFDDGFQSNVRAAELLAQKGISACFFVCPEMVGRDREFLEREFSGIIGDERRMMTWMELKKLVAMGHEIGSHTMSHPTLSELPLEEAIQQIVSSKETLDEKFGEVSHFAWPRGRFHHFRPELVEIVFDTGYSSCSSAERGAHLGKISSVRGCVRRENCEAGWPTSHITYLMGRSVRMKSSEAGSWPDEWNI